MQHYIYLCIVKHNIQNMKITEFAKRAGVHPLTVRRWIKEGKITAVRKQSKGFVFYLDIDESELKKVTANDTRS